MTVKYLGGSTRYLKINLDCDNEIEVAKFKFINQWFDDCFSFKIDIENPMVFIDSRAEFEDIKAIYKIALQQFKNKNSVMEFYESKIKETEEIFLKKWNKVNDYDILMNLSKSFSKEIYQLKKEYMQISNLL